MRLVKMILLSVSLLTIAYNQTERWVYRYDRPGNDLSEAYALVYGLDGNLYSAGYTTNSGTSYDFMVISLTTTGTERWIYQYNGPESFWDRANALVYGSDNNIYAAGYSYGIDTHWDFTVISLTPDGNRRWVYRYNGPGNYDDNALSIVYGVDGNIYAAGYTMDSTSNDLIVISLTSNGIQRWVYRFNAPGIDWSRAYSLVYGADGNIYTSGSSYDSINMYDFTVISLTPDGMERWIYRYNGPGDTIDIAYTLVYGEDDNIYAAGISKSNFSYRDFTVISLSTTGIERWLYRYDGLNSYNDCANSIVYGGDGGIYAAGYCDSTSKDFMVIALTSTGTERWVYRYNGIGNYEDYARSIVYGADGNIYAAGVSYVGRTQNDYDFTLISLSLTGSQRWVYLYNGPITNRDCANCIIYGEDSNIYAAGYSGLNSFDYDLVMISLNPVIGIEEQNLQRKGNKFYISINTYQNQNLTYSLSLPELSTVSLSLYNLQGQKILTWQIPASQGISHYEKYLPNLSPGVYFLKAEVFGREFKDCKKLIVIK